jgi:hypothetical protein
MKNNSKVENLKSPRGKPKGSPKSGGRTIGTPNKRSVWLRDELENAGINWGEEMAQALAGSDFKKAEILIALLPYLNPRMKDKEKEDTPDEQSKESFEFSPSSSLLNILK